MSNYIAQVNDNNDVETDLWSPPGNATKRDGSEMHIMLRNYETSLSNDDYDSIYNKN
jgi:hypothetical protein